MKTKKVAVKKKAATKKASKPKAVKAKAPERGPRLKKTKWCRECRRRKRLREAIQYANGGYDTYCRSHKRSYMREWMKQRRIVQPGYGEPKSKASKASKA